MTQVKKSRGQWIKASTWVAHKRSGETAMLDAAPEPKEKKRRRVKTYGSMVMLNNMHLQTTKKTLQRIFIETDVDGKFVLDPFLWPRVNVASDIGANCVCTDMYLGYGRRANFHSDWDPSHGAQADVAGTLKAVGLWRHQVLYCSAVNAVHGSLLSPPRLRQLRESAIDYLCLNLKLCPLAHIALPEIVAQGCLDIDLAADTVIEEHYIGVVSDYESYASGEIN